MPLFRDALGYNSVYFTKLKKEIFNLTMFCVSGLETLQNYRLPRKRIYDKPRLYESLDILQSKREKYNSRMLLIHGVEDLQNYY